MKQEGDIKKAVQCLREGKLVGLPTETVYGLGGDGRKASVVAKIFAAKERPAFDPLILHFHNASQLSAYIANIPPHFWPLYEAFCPGPLTFILPRKPSVPDIVTAGHSTVGVRFPRHPLTREVLKRCRFPVAAPSANLFGRVSPTEARHVAEQLGSRVDFTLDGGACEVGLESTIIDLSTQHPRILRLGGLPLEAIEEVLDLSIPYEKNSSSKPQAPGMLTSHYSPGIPLLFGPIVQNIPRIDPLRTGVISFCTAVNGIPDSNQRVLSPDGNLAEAATALFGALRSFTADKYDCILAEPFPEEGLGRAINDRLRRAAAH